MFLPSPWVTGGPGDVQEWDSRLADPADERKGECECFATQKTAQGTNF